VEGGARAGPVAELWIVDMTTINAQRVIRAFSFAAILASTSVTAAESDHRFLRSVETISQSDAQVSAVVTATQRTNASPNVSVTWRAGDVTDSASKLTAYAGWFVFVEQPSRVWFFDGDALRLLERRVKFVSDSSSEEVFKSCPKVVRDALPEKIQKRYFK
jgi:hypothetical protein